MSPNTAANWERVPLHVAGDVAWGDTKVTKASYVDSGYRAFSASGADGYLPYFDFDVPGVVVSAIGAKCGKVWFASGQWSCIKNTIRILGRPGVSDARYLYYATSVQGTFPTRGSAQPFIAQTDARSLEIPLPPLDEQLAISSTLGALDDKVESNGRQIQMLEDLGSLMLARVLNIADTAPLVDELMSLGDFLSVLETGSRPKGGVQTSDTGVVSLGAENIQSAGRVTASGFKRVPAEFAASMKRGRLEDGDILVYKDGGRPGNFIPHVSAFGDGFPVEVATINEHVYRVRATPEISQALLYWILKSPWMDREMRIRGTGVAIPGLNSSNFKALPWPKMESTQRDKLNELLEPMLRLMLRLGSENRRLGLLRDTLLPELLSGRLMAATGG